MSIFDKIVILFYTIERFFCFKFTTNCPKLNTLENYTRMKKQMYLHRNNWKNNMEKGERYS